MTVELVPDPAEVIAYLHRMGALLGFEQIRVDRSQIGGTSDKPAAYFEAGYGSKEIVIRTSTGVRCRFDYDRVDYALVAGLMNDLRVVAGLERVDVQTGELA